MTMQPLIARVKNGRLVLDEPTDLPEGAVIELEPVVNASATDEDDLDDEERERLHDAIERGFEDGEAGRTMPARQFLEQLRARAAGR